MTYVLSPGVVSTLVDIYGYSVQRFGPSQADKYLNGIYATFERIDNRICQWRSIPRDFGVSGYFTRYERHLIFWKTLEADEIGIVALLHQSMMQGPRLVAAFNA